MAELPRVVLPFDWIAQAMRSPAVKKALTAHAEKIAERARQIAPVQSGAYRDSIHVEDADQADRPSVRVVADNFKALFIEFGTQDTPRFRVLGRAGEEA